MDERDTLYRLVLISMNSDMYVFWHMTRQVCALYICFIDVFVSISYNG